MRTGLWLHESELSPDEMEGFVYALVIFHENNRFFYFGKKRYRLGGKMKGRESNWARYQSSSRKVADLIKDGAELKQIILSEYRTRSGISWGEVWTQSVARVVEDDRFLNSRIDGVFFNVKEEITDQHERLLNELLKDPDRLIDRLERDGGLDGETSKA